MGHFAHLHLPLAQEPCVNSSRHYWCSLHAAACIQHPFFLPYHLIRLRGAGDLHSPCKCGERGLASQNYFSLSLPLLPTIRGLRISTQSLLSGHFRLILANLKQSFLCINLKENSLQFPVAPCQTWLLLEGKTGVTPQGRFS